MLPKASVAARSLLGPQAVVDLCCAGQKESARWKKDRLITIFRLKQTGTPETVVRKYDESFLPFVRIDVPVG
jgi:hypothetical protein